MGNRSIKFRNMQRMDGRENMTSVTDTKTLTLLMTQKAISIRVTVKHEECGKK